MLLLVKKHFQELNQHNTSNTSNRQKLQKIEQELSDIQTLLEHPEVIHNSFLCILFFFNKIQNGIESLVKNTLKEHQELNEALIRVEKELKILEEVNQVHFF